MNDQEKKGLGFKRLYRILTRDKVLAKLGPMYITRSPWQYIIFGWLLTALLFWMIIRVQPLLAASTEEIPGIWCASGFLMCLAVAVGLLFTFRIKLNGKGGFFLSTVLFALMPFAAYYMVEVFNDVAAYEKEPEVIFMNLLAYALVYLLFLVIFANYRWAVIFATLLLYIFAAACYFIMTFRGTPFVPLDIFSAGTAANVAGNYTFELSPSWVIASVQAAMMAAVGFQLGGANLRRVRWKLTLRALAALVVIGTVSFFFSGSYLAEKGFSLSYWYQQENYEKYGEWLAFCINLRNVYPERPENYSADTVKDIADDMLADNGIAPESDVAYNMLTEKNDYVPGDEKPNIIFIMNESFADLKSLGSGFETNIPVLSFFNSLEENTIRGTTQVSVSGGGTACSEYEALTGNAQRFLPSGAVAYSANIHSSTPSLAWTLRDLGYSTTAFHPYYISGWNRAKAYPYLGFEESIFLENIFPEKVLDMTPAERMAAVEKFDPDDGDVYNRDYMSDHYDYKIIEELYEERDKDKPFFLFNVTIQNHGGYAYSDTNFTEEVKIEGKSGDYPQTERYLSLVRASDQALQELVEYFSEVEEPTLIVFFGDHQPTVDQGFYESLFDGRGADDLNAEELQSRFQTPFLIWANYDIPEKNMGLLSVNYLSTLILETAGLEMPEYNRYLASLYEEVPVISNVGFRDADGTAARRHLDQDYEDLVNDYQCIAYNNLLDYSHRDWSLFTLNGEALPDVETIDVDDLSLLPLFDESDR